MASKTFKIGEYAKGGIINVQITGKVIQINVIDMFTKNSISTGTASTDDRDVERKLDNFLIDITTSYYTGKIMEWIKSKTNLKMMWH